MRFANMLLIIAALAFFNNASAMSGNTESDCPDPYWVCPYFGDWLELSCSFEGAACQAKDCEGVVMGEELKIVATGSRYEKWITMHEGDVSISGYFMPCNLTLTPGATMVDFPDSTYCAFSLITETGLYMEHFVSNPDAPCFGWVECPCEGEAPE